MACCCHFHLICHQPCKRGLTTRSSGAPTAGHQARSGGTRYIFASPGLPSCRRRPLSSNVRPRIHEHCCVGISGATPSSCSVRLTRPFCGTRVQGHGRQRSRPKACAGSAASMPAEDELTEERQRWVGAYLDGASHRKGKNRLSACYAAVEAPGAASTPRQRQLGCSASRVRLALLASSCLAGKNEDNLLAQFMFRRFIAGCSPGVTTATSRPNPSLNRTRYGRQRQPGAQRRRHCRAPGLRCLPPRAG